MRSRPGADRATFRGMTESHLASLALATPVAWAERQRDDECRAELLLDQAHLEKKAAAGATTFLFRVPYAERWQRGLSALARHCECFNATISIITKNTSG